MKKNALLKSFDVLSGKTNNYFTKNTISDIFKFSEEKKPDSRAESSKQRTRDFISFAIVTLFAISSAFAQTFPPPGSCTSGDLLLVGATLPPNAGEDACGTCTPGTTINRTLYLAIDNKTGSTRTSFAFWGTLEIINADGTVFSTTALSGCRGPIIKNSVNNMNFGNLSYPCGKSLRLINLYLAWTSANNNETCPVLTGSPSTINPKCGTLPSIQIVAGLDATIPVTNATCTAGGSISVSPFGGKAPYSVTIGGVTHSGIAAGGTTTFTNLPVATYSISISDATAPTPCTTVKSRTVGSASAVSVNAGSDFTKTCSSNASGGNIGEVAETGYTYSWTSNPVGFTSSASNPSVNPSVTTTYTVIKTNDLTGCHDDDDVTVTVDTALPTANAGNDVTINCNTPSTTLSASGGVSYSWSVATGLSATNIANPIATPSSTITYTVTVTGANGCSKTDDVTVTVDKALPPANAGSDVTINCTTPSTTLSASGGVSYSWSPATGLSATNIANPTATPAATTTYTVTVTGANGCSKTDDVTVTVDKALPSANAGSDVTINCTTPSTTLSASGGVSYSWSPATGLSATNIANPTATPVATTTYMVTVTGANGCSKTDDVTVTVNKALPSANAGSDVTINCTTPSTTLSASGGVSYSWSPATGLSATNIANPTATPASTTTYTVTVTGANGCSKTDDVTVTVNKALPTANAGSDVTLNCNTTSTTLSASGGVSYSWSPATGLSATNIANPTATPATTTTYTVTVTGSNGCSKTDDVIVTVDNTMPDPPTICVVQPSLCGPVTGSITILSPLDQNLYEYSIDNGGHWQSGAVFSNLSAGSVTGIKVRNKISGCESGAATCDDSNCLPPDSKISDTYSRKATTVESNKITTTNVDFDAYPVPFKDQLTIRYNFDSPKVKIEVYNILGSLIFSKEDTNGYSGKEYILNLSNRDLKTQMNFIKVTTDKGSSFKKVISSK